MLEADRPLLPVLSSHVGGRDAMTCHYRCGNACDHPVPNRSANEYLGDIVNAALSRRGVFQAGALVVGVAAAGTVAVTPAAAAHGGRPGALTFPPVPPNQLDRVVVPGGYDHAVVIRWGDPVLPGAPA